MTEETKGGIVPSEELLANGFAFSECKCMLSTVFCCCSRCAILLLEQGQGLRCSPQYCCSKNNLFYFLCFVSSKDDIHSYSRSSSAGLFQISSNLLSYK